MRQGGARWASRGKAKQGKVRTGVANGAGWGGATESEVGPGGARHGMVGQGGLRRGMAGETKQGGARERKRGGIRRGLAWTGWARQVEAKRGEAR